MAKAEISWVRTSEEGAKLQVYAHRSGGRWKFYSRERRFDQWQDLEHPPLGDWLELLDAVRRRVQRRLLPPQELQRVEQSIREQFPEAKF